MEEKVMKKFVIDVRFIINAKEDWLAANKLDEFLPEANDDVEQYTPINRIRLFKEADDWIYVGVDNPKLQKLIDESVKLR
jgi:hypothetical protein